MFPELHETFILRELAALERRGVRFDIFSLQYPRDPITLDDAIRLTNERTHYSGLLSAAVLAATFRSLLKRPVPLLRAMARVIWQGRDRPLDVLKNLAVLPVSLFIGEQGRRLGVTHWHGHWTNVPTTSCWYLGQIHGDSWSAAIHGEDIFPPTGFCHTNSMTHCSQSCVVDISAITCSSIWVCILRSMFISTITDLILA